MAKRSLPPLALQALNHHFIAFCSKCFDYLYECPCPSEHKAKRFILCSACKRKKEATQ